MKKMNLLFDGKKGSMDKLKHSLLYSDEIKVLLTDIKSWIYNHQYDPKLMKVLESLAKSKHISLERRPEASVVKDGQREQRVKLYDEHDYFHDDNIPTNIQLSCELLRIKSDLHKPLRARKKSWKYILD